MQPRSEKPRNEKRNNPENDPLGIFESIRKAEKDFRDMNSPGDDLDERLRKAREEAAEYLSSGGLEPGVPKFVEFATMYKVESRPRPGMELDETPRQLECVNCGVLMLWTTYRLDPLTFDRKCKDCGVRVKDFYKTRPHQEVNDASTSERNDG